MRDVIFLAIVVAFFILAALYVRACAAIVGADELLTTDDSDSDLDIGGDADEKVGAVAR
jgi:hypothetical protein